MISITGHKGGLHEITSDLSYGVVFGKAVSTPSGDQMNDPTERSRRPDPRNSGQYQPQNADNDPSVVNLADSGHQKTQNTCYPRFAHCLNHLRSELRAPPEFVPENFNRLKINVWAGPRRSFRGTRERRGGPLDVTRRTAASRPRSGFPEAPESACRPRHCQTQEWRIRASAESRFPRRRRIRPRRVRFLQ